MDRLHVDSTLSIQVAVQTWKTEEGFIVYIQHRSEARLWVLQTQSSWCRVKSEADKRRWSLLKV